MDFDQIDADFDALSDYDEQWEGLEHALDGYGYFSVLDVAEDLGQQVQEHIVLRPRQYLTLERENPLTYFDNDKFRKEIGLSKNLIFDLSHRLLLWLEPRTNSRHNLSAHLKVIIWATYARSPLYMQKLANLFYMRMSKNTVSRIVRLVW